MTRCGLVAALSFASAFATHVAFAHAYPKTETPAANSTVHTAPSEVAIEFDDELEPKFSSIVVQDAKGTRVDDGHSQVASDDPKHLAVGVKPLAAGTYKVIWRVTDTDTHKTQGSYRFTVKP
jgi:methionine-rich copper-binding protein CopC